MFVPSNPMDADEEGTSLDLEQWHNLDHGIVVDGAGALNRVAFNFAN